MSKQHILKITFAAASQIPHDNYNNNPWQAQTTFCLLFNTYQIIIVLVLKESCIFSTLSSINNYWWYIVDYNRKLC